MRHILIAILAAATLGGCTSYGDAFGDGEDAYCEDDATPQERARCRDRAEQRRRDSQRDY